MSTVKLKLDPSPLVNVSTLLETEAVKRFLKDNDAVSAWEEDSIPVKPLPLPSNEPENEPE